MFPISTVTNTEEVPILLPRWTITSTVTIKKEASSSRRWTITSTVTCKKEVCNRGDAPSTYMSADREDVFIPEYEVP